MSTTQIETVTRVFRRNIRLAQALRIMVLLAMGGLLFRSLVLPGDGGRTMFLLVALGGLMLWMAFLLRSVRLLREIQAGNLLIAIGRLDDAEARISRMLKRFSLSARGQFMLLQQLAGLLFHRDRYQDVVLICRELLRNGIGRIQGLGLNTRLLLADCLLLLGDVNEAYKAIRPVYDLPLTLSERMKLLPIQLRYELAAGHTAAAAQELVEKVQVAELLDSPHAALVHALLAEACRRESRTSQQAYLAERARLYHDLQPLAEKYPVIRPLLGSGTTDDVERMTNAEMTNDQ